MVLGGFNGILLLFWLWANLHAGWLAGLGEIGYNAGQIADLRRDKVI